MLLSESKKLSKVDEDKQTFHGNNPENAVSPDMPKIFRKANSNKIGIDRPLTPAKVNSDHFTVYKSEKNLRRKTNDVRRTNSAEPVDKKVAEEDLEERKSCMLLFGENQSEPNILSKLNQSQPDVTQRSLSNPAASETNLSRPNLPEKSLNKPNLLKSNDNESVLTNFPSVRMRDKSSRTARPASLFVSSVQSKSSLSVSQSIDTNFFTSIKDPSPAGATFGIKTSSISRLDRQISHGKIDLRRGSLPRMTPTPLFPSSPNDNASKEFLKHVVFRKKKDSPKEAEAKNNHRKSMPSMLTKKRNSVSNFRILKSVFGRSSNTAESVPTGLPKEKIKTPLSNRRQSLPLKKQIHQEAFRNVRNDKNLASSPSLHNSRSAASYGFFGWRSSTRSSR